MAVYLIQTGGSPPNLLRQARGRGSRHATLNYTNPPGIDRVPSTSAANIEARPAPVFNPNGVNSDYDLIARTGSGTGTDAPLSASITEGLIDPTDPLPPPGSEDPLNDHLRMLIGTFTFVALELRHYEYATATDPFVGVQILSGPNPPINGSRNDGTNGPLPGNGFQGEIQIDQYLAKTCRRQ